MASTTFGVVGPLTGTDDKGLENVRRSRLSLHMKTRRARRWLLVQLVSVPVSQEQENGEPQVGQTARERDEIRNGRDNMVANYHMAQPTRTWI